MEQQSSTTKTRGSNGRSPSWLFTWNNPSLRGVLKGPGDGQILAKPGDARFLIYQWEEGVQKTPHLQGYIQWNIAQRLSKCKHWLPAAHWEIAYGTPQQNIDYCSKEKTRLAGPYSEGDPSFGAGTRTDLRSVAIRALEEGSISGIIRDAPEVVVRYSRGLQLLASKAPPPYRPDLKVLLIVGPTCLGKTYLPIITFGHNVYQPYYGNNGVWFDGYDQQPIILLDEFRGQMPLQKFLQFLDPYPLRVETKGGSVSMFARLIIVTSNSQPESWYDNTNRPQEITALLRRFGLSGNKQSSGYSIQLGFDSKQEDLQEMFLNWKQLHIGAQYDDNLIVSSKTPAPPQLTSSGEIPVFDIDQLIYSEDDSDDISRTITIDE